MSSSSQDFPPLTGTIDPAQMSTTTAEATTSMELYPSQYAYSHDHYHSGPHYITPLPSSTVEPQPWTQYARASVPDIHLNTAHGMYPPRGPNNSPPVTDPGRPRSSPSTFGPQQETIPWTVSSGLGIQYTTAGGHPTPPVTSTFPPNVFQRYPTDDNYSSSPPLLAPQPHKPYPNIAPSPYYSKRKRDEDDYSDYSLSSRQAPKRKRTSSVVASDLSEDDKYLVKLKEEENLPWKDIATRFQNDRGKSFQVAALQMRYKRLREKFRMWEEQDLQSLKLAHEYWEKYKWEIISAKMLDFGIQERWPARHCARKWQEMEAAHAVHSSAGWTPATLSQLSSPVEGHPSTQFAFIPNHYQ